MNLTEAIACYVDSCERTGTKRPSHCDVRCFINGAIANNPRYVVRGYDQDRAWQTVRRMLGTPVKLSESPYASKRGWSE